MNKILISVVGPTAIGKTNLGVTLSRYFNAEIISADSRQFYKELSIGTAVPSIKELSAAPHHFIQHKSIHDTYTVGDFEQDAITKITALHKKNSIAIMVGGSGLYVKSVTEGLDHFPKIDPNIRQELNLKLERDGLEALQKDLQQVDPKTYEIIARDNPQRVIRALEISIGSGQPYSTFLKGKPKNRGFKTITVGLNAPRPIIYERINERVDIMIQNGLLNEVKDLVDYQHLNPLNTVGYKELFQYFKGTFTLEKAIAEIKKNTRRFAKRQLTWFRKDSSIHWFDYQTNPEKIIATIEKTIQ